MKLMIDDIPAAQLAAQFGTPLYVYSQTKLEQQMKEFAASFSSPDFDCHVVYASKAFCCIAMMQLVNQEGLWCDVVSGGELYTAMKAGFPMDHVVFHGNNKTDGELRLALEAGVGTIVVDNLDEMHRLAFLSQSWPDTVTNVLLRINPGVEAHTHKYIITADPDSKFGTNITDTDTIDEMARIAHASQRLHFAGFHAHIGSQIFETAPFDKEAEIICQFAKAFQDRTGLAVTALDLGGGFGVSYTAKDRPLPVSQVCRHLLSVLSDNVKKYGLSVHSLYIEPGRSITAPAGLTLYTVGGIKSTPHKKYVFVDGGMSDNIRPALYQAEYEAVAADPASDETETVTIAGKCCESGDILASDVELAPVKNGDVIAVLATGAYGHSMASRYNKLPVPGVVFVRGDRARYVIEPETYEDLVAGEKPL